MASITRCCDSTCDVETGGPHWGDVIVVGEDYYIDEYGGDYTWIHACEGHANMAANGLYHVEDYITPPEGCETIRDDDDAAFAREKVTNG